MFGGFHNSGITHDCDLYIRIDEKDYIRENEKEVNDLDDLS